MSVRRYLAAVLLLGAASICWAQPHVEPFLGIERVPQEVGYIYDETNWNHTPANALLTGSHEMTMVLVTGDQSHISAPTAQDEFDRPLRFCSLQSERDSVQHQANPKRKNPDLAFGIAFVPGFVVHGLGHVYVGRYWTAAGIFGLEVLSIGAGLNVAIGEVAQSESGPRQDWSGWWLASFALFFGSWAYDFVAAPIETKRINQSNKVSVRINPELRQDLAGLSVSISYW